MLFVIKYCDDDDDYDIADDDYDTDYVVDVGDRIIALNYIDGELSPRSLTIINCEHPK